MEWLDWPKRYSTSWAKLSMLSICTCLLLAPATVINTATTTDDDGPSDKQLIYDISKHHLPTLLVFYFFQAFVVASLVEEITKFFCFWMVEHPDIKFLTGDVSGGDEDGEMTSMKTSRKAGGSSYDDDEEEEQGDSVVVPTSKRSIHSKSAAVTVGLVTTAAGFACVENLLYCVGAGTTFSSDLSLLFIRAVLPAHPICAALQSIGLVRRDIEGDARHGFGRIILPAVILHGTFDYLLMVTTVLHNNQKPPPDDDDDSLFGGDDEAPLTWFDIIVALIVGIVTLCPGIIYYMREAKKQHERLDSLESTTAGDMVRGRALL